MSKIEVRICEQCGKKYECIVAERYDLLVINECKNCRFNEMYCKKMKSRKVFFFYCSKNCENTAIILSSLNLRQLHKN